MNSKVIAGAIIALIVIIATAAVALSLTSNNQVRQQPAECTVHGFVIDTFGQGLPGLSVTLHIMGDAPEEQAMELYNFTTTTGGKPTEGQYVFNNVTIPQGTKYAYVETSTTVDGITSYGRSNNYSLKANDNLTMSIVLKLLSASQAIPATPNMCKVLGTVVD